MFDSEGAFAPDVRTRRDCTVRDAPRRARMHAAEAPRDGRCCPADVAPRTQARAGARAKMPDSVRHARSCPTAPRYGASTRGLLRQLTMPSAGGPLVGRTLGSRCNPLGSILVVKLETGAISREPCCMGLITVRSRPVSGFTSADRAG